MHSALVGSIAFVCTFAGALLGMWLRTAVPQHHMTDETRDTISAGVGLIATMTALVLGLITASAKSSYDTVETAVRATAIDILTLDRLLARYGPEADPVRATLKTLVAQRVDTIWPTGRARPVQLDPQLAAAESLIDRIGGLRPHTASQEAVRPRAMELAESLLKVRWMVAEEGRSIPLPFLVILLIAVLFVCSLSIGCALFLVLELDSPFDGWLKVSAAPMRYALSRLGQ